MLTNIPLAGFFKLAKHRFDCCCWNNNCGNRGVPSNGIWPTSFPCAEKFKFMHYDQTRESKGCHILLDHRCVAYFTFIGLELTGG